MANALFVNICQNYAALNAVDRRPQAERLRLATIDAWRIDLNSAAGVEFLFGVVRGVVVCAYRVRPAAEWPLKEGTDLRIVLTEGAPFTKAAFAKISARGLFNKKYGLVTLDEAGVFRLHNPALAA